MKYNESSKSVNEFYRKQKNGKKCLLSEPTGEKPCLQEQALFSSIVHHLCDYTTIRFLIGPFQETNWERIALVSDDSIYRSMISFELIAWIAV